MKKGALAALFTLVTAACLHIPSAHVEEFSNLFMDEDGVQTISDWDTYRSDRYQQVAGHLQDRAFRYIWLESNPIAFNGIPFVIYRAMEEMYGKNPADPLSAESLEAAGVRPWRKQDQDLVKKYYGDDASKLFYFSDKFNFPVGMNETRIIPGEPATDGSPIEDEAVYENQNRLRVPWVEARFSEENGLDHLQGSVIEMFTTDDNGEQKLGKPAPMASFKTTSLRSVTFACGACHIGRVRLNHEGEEGYLPLVGAPNIQFDTHTVANAFVAVLMDENFTAENVRKVIEDKKPEWFYAPDDPSQVDASDPHLKVRLAQTQMELDFLLNPLGQREIIGIAVAKVTGKDPKTLPPEQVQALMAGEQTGPAIKAVMGKLAGNSWLDLILPEVKKALLVDKVAVNKRLLMTTYHHEKNGIDTAEEAEKYLSAPTPGRVDTLGTPFSAFAIEKGESIEQWGKFMERYIAKNDYPSIWRQDRREISNWDGTVGAFYRNIGSGLSLGQDPDMLDFRNGLIQKDFLEKLPSPAYPFAVDLALANKGKQLYQSYCQSCHNVKVTREDRDTDLNGLDTDTNRAQSIPDPMAKFLAEKILEACKDKSLTECQPRPDGDTQHVVAVAEPGYKNDALGGIWARAPYLHNGSVPTMRHLLQPSTRPDKFCRGSLDYDTSNMGFGWEMANGSCEGADHQVAYDTTLPSQKNTGHSGMGYLGVEGDMSGEDADALIEYMRTF